MKSKIKKVKQDAIPVEIINYDKKQLLVINGNGRVVITTGTHCSHTFTGVCVYDIEPMNIGLFGQWIKNDSIHRLQNDKKIILKN